MKYTPRKIGENLSEWFESREKEAITIEEIRMEDSLPRLVDLRKNYPTVRDGVVENGHSYRRNDWVTEFSLEEEDYPGELTNDKERDMYAYVEEHRSNKDPSYGQVSEDLGISFQEVMTTLAPLYTGL